MLTAKQIELLTLLLKHETSVTASFLAHELHISVRSIKSYVASINSEGNNKIIVSSNKGYRLADKSIAESLIHGHSTIPESYIQRAYLLIRKILIDHQEVDSFDFCHEVFISYSTLKSDLAKWNIAFKRYHVRFATKQSKLVILADETSKRKLLAKIIFEEADHKLLDIATLYKLYSQETVQHLSRLLRRHFDQNKIYINDYSFMNMLLHLLIILDRVKKGSSLSYHPVKDTPQQQQNPLVISLCESIEKQFKVDFNANEKEEIDLLARSNINSHLINSDLHLSKIIDQNSMSLTQTIVNNVYNNYGIDLSKNSFIIPFSLHLNTLYHRIKRGAFNPNPLLSNIKLECPLIYEIAIFVSLFLSDVFNQKIPEDEIAYLALHIGTELERQKSNEQKLKCILLCPNYLDWREQLYNKLLFHFGSDIHIIEIASHLSEVTSKKYDILITTTQMDYIHSSNIYYICPLNFDDYTAELTKKLRELKFSLKKKQVLAELYHLFNPTLFFVDPPMENKVDIIEFLCTQLLKQGYVNKSYFDQVMEREGASSTDFDDLAVPHAMKCNAIKTVIPVIISHKGIIWKSKPVHVILLPTISELDKKHFAALYEVILSLFNQRNLKETVLTIHSFDDFYQYIYSNLNT